MSPNSITPAQIDSWTEQGDIVAVHLEQHLVPVEGAGSVFFPPTYASNDRSSTPYCIDTLSDGTKTVLVDSVGSQANRMEPIFLTARARHLVPQITIAYGDKKKDNDGRVSLLEAGHRLGDAVVRCTELKDEAQKAFKTLLRSGDATALAKLGPTSLIFGAWDSRDTMAKIPRLLQSTIRAWDVSPLKRSAQYTATLDYAALDVFTEKDKEKAEGSPANPLAQRGFVHVPSTDTHGGVIASGPIRRDVTLNLVQLRRLEGENTQAMRRYLLGLALVAALEPMDPFLRQGCLLVPDPEAGHSMRLVKRDGTREDVTLTAEEALQYASKAAEAFGVGPNRDVTFDKKLAQRDAKEKK